VTLPANNRLLAAVFAATGLLLLGCADDEEETASLPSTSAPTVGPAPAPTTTQPAATAPAKPQKTAPEPTPAEPTSDPNACETGKTISRLSFKGVPCEEAAALAAAWEQEQNRCSTIDDPGKPEGYNRTCTLEDYTCKTKRDVKSDARFVACAKGSAQVRFTWAP
jgi:hypothetical protein